MSQKLNAVLRLFNLLGTFSQERKKRALILASTSAPLHIASCSLCQYFLYIYIYRYPYMYVCMYVKLLSQVRGSLIVIIWSKFAFQKHWVSKNTIKMGAGGGGGGSTLFLKTMCATILMLLSGPSWPLLPQIWDQITTLT